MNANYLAQAAWKSYVTEEWKSSKGYVLHYLGLMLELIPTGQGITMKLYYLTT